MKFNRKAPIFKFKYEMCTAPKELITNLTYV